MLSPIIWNQLNKHAQTKVLQRPSKKDSCDFKHKVQEIIAHVRNGGDEACKEMTKKYDGIAIDSLKVQANEFKEAHEKVKDLTRQAIFRVITQLHAFHSQQLLTNIRVETSKGIICERKPLPIECVGLYIPGESAPLVSTVLMLGVPAKIANCPVRVLCSPPQPNGQINLNILIAAELCGIKNIYKLGGAQAIAAMAYGTETIPKVNKIFGPGNSWVTEAKMQVSQDVAGALYDMPAGPSEVMVIADENANAAFVAADLLSQAEHGPDSQVFFICSSKSLANKVSLAIESQITKLPRKNIAKLALQNSCLIIVNHINEAINIANEYAPEHLILQLDEPRNYLEKIKNAGSVFLGAWSPESAGDYASGTNHVLPTYGFAKNLSGLSVADFMKTITIQELTQEGLADIADTIKELATIEGLEGHKNAVDIRLREKRNAE